MDIITAKNKFIFQNVLIEGPLFMFDGTTSKPVGKEEDGD